MSKRFRLVRLFGFQITVDYTWFVVFILAAWSLSEGYFPRVVPGFPPSTYWIMGFAASLLLFASVLVHELSHSLVAKKHGLAIRGITLFIFGGMAEMAEEPKDPSTELRMAAAGPITSLALALFFLLFNTGFKAFLPESILAVTRYLVYLNIVLAAFNLIPGFPLDGGRMLRAILWVRTGSFSRATIISSRLGKWFAYCLIFLGVFNIMSGRLAGLWYVMIGIFLHQAAQVSYLKVTSGQDLFGIKIGDIMSRDVVTVNGSLPLDRLVEDYFFKHRFHGFPVVDDGRVLGCVTLKDVKQIQRPLWPSTRTSDLLDPARGTTSLQMESAVVEALRIMVQTNQGRLPVFDNNRLAGIITRRDIMDLLQVRTDLGK